MQGEEHLTNDADVAYGNEPDCEPDQRFGGRDRHLVREVAVMADGRGDRQRENHEADR